MPDTFFTRPPHWDWLIVFYFFVGGIAGGSFFLAALLHFFGRAADRPIVHLGYKIAFIGAIISGILLIVDLDKPLRFWHMMIESETGRPMFKGWAPMSVGAWALLLFGLFAFLAWLGVRHEEGRTRWTFAGRLAIGPLGAFVAVVGGVLGFFIAGYTGVLLSVTNRPIWADSNWLGLLFLLSAASTAAATLILLARRRALADAVALDNLARFDKWVLVLELVVLVIFVISLGAAARAFLNAWGVVLVLFVVIAGILLPLGVGFGRVTRIRDWTLTPTTAAALVLFGGFMLRVATIIASEDVSVAGHMVIGR